MQDFDKWPAVLQWLLGAGAFIGATLAAWFGSRAAKRRGLTSADAEQELEQARATIRDSALRHELEQVIAATRKSFSDEFDGLERRLRNVEQDVVLLKNRRSPPRHRGSE